MRRNSKSVGNAKCQWKKPYCLESRSYLLPHPRLVTTAQFFAALAGRSGLKSLYAFKNERFLFPAIEHTVTFALLTFGGSKISFPEMEFCWLAWTVEEMANPARRVRLSPKLTFPH